MQKSLLGQKEGEEMKLEQQVCNLELAKKLKELGVKQESLWYWVHNKIKDDWKLTILTQCFKDHPESWEYYSAFTVSECLVIYGEEITIPKRLSNVADFIAKKIVDKLSA